MEIVDLLTKEIKTKEEAVSLLSEFLADVTSSKLSHACSMCGKHPYSCSCWCDECDEHPSACYCERESIQVEKLKEADAFAKKWNIPFDADLHMSIIDRVSQEPDAIWNSSSAVC